MASPGTIYRSIADAKEQGKKCFALLIDPDEVRLQNISSLMKLSEEAGVDLIFVGGSLLMHDQLSNCILELKANTHLPVVLFPGSPLQINNSADAILFLSLISGRNPELLIGQQVISAPYLHQSQLEVISTGYMLIDGGAPTTATYMSNTNPIPSDKPDIALATALAGEMLGFKTIYMDAGSGARNPVSESMIRRVSEDIKVPIIVGGGIRTSERAFLTASAGADVVVVGNAIEKDRRLLRELVEAVHSGAQSR
ncbi:MAG: geranylgeranylglyceryl/heptaprenylglyceryl phosphate synthase [Chitinophagales bacterium]|nr:geranylgeranylglyceryl/heptaprenylglyceryl phosphate synthase [Chitinophagales bacterium]